MKKKYIVMFVIVVSLLIVWTLLPLIVNNQINKQIDELEGYSGEVKGVSMELTKWGDSRL